MVHREEAAEVVDAPQVGCGGGKRERGTGPGEQPQPFQAEEGGPERCPADPTDQSVEFTWRVVRDLGRVDLAAPRDHLVRRKPDPEIHEPDTPGAVEPPEETELLDRQKYKASDRLARRIWDVGSCG
jgi:hypothetical protein